MHAFDDAGHYVLEDKHEVLVPAIRAFLDAHPCGSGISMLMPVSRDCNSRGTIATHVAPT